MLSAYGPVRPGRSAPAATRRPGPRRLAAIGVIAAITLAACTSNGTVAAESSTGNTPVAPTAGGADSIASNPGDDSTGEPTDDVDVEFSADDIPDADAITAVGQDLPDDPAEAASALVDTMFGSDTATASAATGELLRRAGLPLLGDGPIVAMPDHFVITNAQIDVALLPEYTEQVREGLAFDLDQVQALLTHLGAPRGAFSDEQLVGTLADWGKGAGDAAESRTAGAAVRALAAKHHQLLAPADLLDEATMTALEDKPESLPLDEYQRLIDYPTQITLDPLQVLLLVAHIAGAVTDAPVQIQVDPAAGAQHLRGEQSGALVTAGLCTIAQNAWSSEPGKVEKGILKSELQKAIKEDIGERWGKDVAESLGDAFKGYDKLADVLSYLAFVEALHIDITPDKQSTHFLHDEPAHANDVFFTAKAYVKSSVPEKYHDCLGLVGIDIPNNTELKDMQITWTLPNGRVGLKPAVVGGRQFDVPYLLDDHGESTVQTTPRREKNPPKPGEKQPQSTVIQTVKVSLDKNYLTWHASDIALLIYSGPEGAVAETVYKVVVALIKEASLPSKTAEFPVTYHGSNAYHIYGDAVLSLPFYADVPLKADLYSCDGAAGPWKGSITVGGSAGPILKLAGHLAGYKGPDSGEDVLSVNFNVNPQTAQLQKFPFGDTYGLVVQLDEEAVNNGLQKDSGTGQVAERMKRIGWASWTLGGQDVRVLAGLIGGFMSQSLDLPVEAVSGDLRCGGTALYENEFD